MDRKLSLRKHRRSRRGFKRKELIGMKPLSHRRFQHARRLRHPIRTLQRDSHHGIHEVPNPRPPRAFSKRSRRRQTHRRLLGRRRSLLLLSYSSNHRNRHKSPHPREKSILGLRQLCHNARIPPDNRNQRKNNGPSHRHEPEPAVPKGRPMAKRPLLKTQQPNKN